MEPTTTKATISVNDIPMIKRHSLPIIYSILFLISAVFMLIFSLWTSPLYKNWYGCDASFFTLVGRGILEGRVPYRDFYDLKGPYFFFTEALGQLICRGRTGIFILQILALFLALVLMYRIGRLYISHNKTLLVITFFILAYICLLWGGNCLEEFCLPVTLLAIYLNLPLFDSTASLDLPAIISGNSALRCNRNVVALISGVCFTVMAFSKITVAAPLVGMVMAIFITHMINKDYKKLFFYCVYFILGALLAFIPLLIYYGINGSILNMLHCVFVFGMKRSAGFKNNLSLSLEYKLTGVIFGMIFAITHRKKLNSFQSITVFLMSLVTYIVLHLGDSFIYYFITGMPCMLLAMILFMRIYDPLILFYDFKQSICYILIFMFAFQFADDSINQVRTFIYHNSDTEQSQYYENSLNMGALIPECDRDSVFSFDIDMQWFEINKIMPCNKYVVNLQYFIALEPQIETELYNYFDTTPPKWMIISNTLEDYLPQFNELVMNRYDCLYITDVGQVYLLKE